MQDRIIENLAQNTYNLSYRYCGLSANLIILSATVGREILYVIHNVTCGYALNTPVQDKAGDGTYIYFYGQGSYREDDIYMARVPRAELESFTAYEYFAGRRADGTSLWTKNAAEARPLVELENGGSSICVAYNEPLGKWMLTYYGTGIGNRIRFADTVDGIYSEAQTILSKNDAKSFINYKPAEGYPFTNYTKGTYNIYGAYVSSRWISEDGKSFYCILSQFYYCYNVSLVKVELDVTYAE
ncbi:MAG: DUF4185 domain-containing protein [Clostridia bacterium]|nr:DUF4185 domain-containing protein [Clostridia bacterium]MBQ7011699.1 DUF4185 domain-containing protein [Clostridia bacterium]